MLNTGTYMVNFGQLTIGLYRRPCRSLNQTAPCAPFVPSIFAAMWSPSQLTGKPYPIGYVSIARLLFG